MATATTLQVGYWNTLTDAFTAYPFSPTGAIYDLNDNVAWTLVDDDQGFGVGLSIDPPSPEVLRTANSRSVGERVVRRNYSHNRVIRATLLQIPQTSAAAWNANLRTLIQLCESISATQPAALKIQLTSSSTPVYADVLEAHVVTRYKETLFAQLMNDQVVVEFECRPFLRGPRQTHSNLVWNPGFEAPAGPGVNVFADQISTLNAYTTLSGAPSLSSNNIICPAGTAVLFGSAVWGAVNSWQCRFNLTTGATASFYVHYVDANNWVRFDVNTTTYALYHQISGTIHTIVSGSITTTLSTASYYWVNITQFPAAPGTQPDVAITINNDSTGAIGSVNTTVATSALYSNSVTSGKMGLLAQSATVNFGGYTGKVTNSVALFGPGAWILTNFTNNAFGAWDQSTSDTYSGGAVTSYGAARIDAPPTGAFDAGWSNYAGGTPAGTNALPVSAAGNVLAASAWVKTSGLGASGSVALTVREWDASGNSLRQTTLQTLTGNVAAWTQMSGTVTTGANTAYVDVILLAMDSTSGSANAMVWFDNVQCWNETTTGQMTIPYCELRFPQSPAQILLTGVLGDVPAPALVSIGAFFSSLSNGSQITLRLGRRATPTLGWSAIANPTESNTTPGLSSAVYGGYTASQTAVNTGASFATRCTEADLQGIYHLLGAATCSQTTANVVKNTVRIAAALFRGLLTSPTYLTGFASAVIVAGFQAQNVAAVIDGGQYTIPFSARGVMADLSTVYENLSLQYGDPTGSSTTATSWMALLPIDGGYLAATFIVSSGLTITSQWLWLYSDGIATQIGQPASWRFSAENTGVSAPSNGVGGTGSATSGYASVNPAADGFLSLDPHAVVNGVNGVNQALAQWNDQNGAPLALAMDIQYSPLYLWPL